MLLQLALSSFACPAPPPPAAGEGEIVQHTLPCGVELFLLDDPEVTAVKGSIFVDAGSEAEPADRVGLVRVLSDALGRGGGEQHPAAEIDAWFKEHDGDVNVSRDRRSITIDFFCAPEAAGACLEMFRDVLARPAYGAAQIEDARRRLIAVAGTWTRDPGFVANRGVYELAYGARVPGRRALHVEDAERISRDDLLAFHRAHVGSNRLRIALHGPLEDGLTDSLEAAFAELGRTAPAPALDWPAFRRPDGLRLVVLDLPDAEHTELRVGFASVAHGHADAPALQLWSAYHEGRGRARSRPRSVEEVRAALRVQFSFERMITAGVGVETESAAAALRVLLELLAPGDETELDPARLELARETLVAHLRPRDDFVRARNAALRHMSGRTEAATAAHTAGIEALTAEEVIAAARRHATGAGLVAVVAGPAERLVPLLAGYEPVEVRRGLRQPRGSAAGLDLRDRALAAVGGADRWAALETYVLEGATTVPGLDRPVAVRVLHDLARGALRIEQTAPGAEPIATVTTTEASWSVVAGSHVPLDEDQHASLRSQERRTVIQLLHTLAQGRGVRVEAGEGGRLVLHDNARVLAWIELGEDGLPVSCGFEGPDGAARQSELRAWSRTDGLAFPERVLSSRMESHWTSFAPDAELDPALFVRPVR